MRAAAACERVLISQERPCRVVKSESSKTNTDSSNRYLSHEQTTVRKPDHCAAGAGSTGQSMGGTVTRFTPLTLGCEGGPEGGGIQGPTRFVHVNP